MMNLQDNNKLIAKFMGHIEVDGVKFDLAHLDDHVDELEYNSSWDWLMPVVAKISNVWCDSSGDLFDLIEDGFDEVMESLSEVDIREVYIAVCNFIKTYNIYYETEKLSGK